jgi:hypothetical protein
MDMDISIIDGSCHCGTVHFRVRLTNGLHTARRCTCSYCRMRGAVAVSADLGGVDILSGEEALMITKVASAAYCNLLPRSMPALGHQQPPTFATATEELASIPDAKDANRRHAVYYRTHR